MTKDTTKEAAVAADHLLSTIGSTRSRPEFAVGFIETMLEEELSGALSRPLRPAEAGRG